MNRLLSVFLAALLSQGAAWGIDNDKHTKPVILPMESIPLVVYHPVNRLPNEKKYLGTVFFSLIRDQLLLQKQIQLRKFIPGEAEAPPDIKEVDFLKNANFDSLQQMRPRLAHTTGYLSTREKILVIEKKYASLSNALDPLYAHIILIIEPGKFSGSIQLMALLKIPFEKIQTLSVVTTEEELAKASSQIAADLRKQLGQESTGYLSVDFAASHKTKSASTTLHDKVVYSVFLDDLWVGDIPFKKIPVSEGSYSFTVYASASEPILTKTIRIMGGHETKLQVQKENDHRKPESYDIPIGLRPGENAMGCFPGGIRCQPLFYTTATLGVLSFAAGSIFLIQEEMERDSLIRALPANQSDFTSADYARIDRSKEIQKNWNLAATISYSGALFFFTYSLYAYLTDISQRHPSPSSNETSNKVSYLGMFSPNRSFVAARFNF